MDGDRAFVTARQHYFEGLGLRERPANQEAEQSIIGTLMWNGKLYGSIADKLQPHHFADPVHRAIFTEQCRRLSQGEVANAVTLKEWFDAEPSSGDVNGFEYLAQLTTAMIAPAMLVPYADAVIAAWRKRQVIEAAEDLLAAGFDNAIDPVAAIPELIARLETAFDERVTKASGSLSDAVMDAIRASEAVRDGTGPRPIKTGFASIDEFCGGFEPGTLNVLAGRPGMGKSALGHQIGINVARQGIGVLEISLEMTSMELGRRALSLASGVPATFIKRGDLTPWQVDKVFKARNELRDLPLFIDDGPGLSMAQISAKVRAAKRRHDIGLIIIDHLHIIRPEDSDVRQGATWAVGRISGAMKRLAKEHGCPVLLLAQLNRGVEGREDKRPNLSDLRQAGDIEQDADSVSFVYRPEYYLPKAEPEKTDSETPDRFQKRLDGYRDRKDAFAGKAELIFAKVRDGQTGTVNLNFHGATTSFSDIDA